MTATYKRSENGLAEINLDPAGTVMQSYSNGDDMSKGRLVHGPACNKSGKWMFMCCLILLLVGGVALVTVATVWGVLARHTSILHPIEVENKFCGLVTSCGLTESIATLRLTSISSDKKFIERTIALIRFCNKDTVAPLEVWEAILKICAAPTRKRSAPVIPEPLGAIIKQSYGVPPSVHCSTLYSGQFPRVAFNWTGYNVASLLVSVQCSQPSGHWLLYNVYQPALHSNTVMQAALLSWFYCGLSPMEGPSSLAIDPPPCDAAFGHYNESATVEVLPALSCRYCAPQTCATGNTLWDAYTTWAGFNHTLHNNLFYPTCHSTCQSLSRRVVQSFVSNCVPNQPICLGPSGCFIASACNAETIRRLRQVTSWTTICLTGYIPIGRPTHSSITFWVPPSTDIVATEVQSTVAPTAVTKTMGDIRVKVTITSMVDLTQPSIWSDLIYNTLIATPTPIPAMSKLPRSRPRVEKKSTGVIKAASLKFDVGLLYISTFEALRTAVSSLFMPIKQYFFGITNGNRLYVIRPYPVYSVYGFGLAWKYGERVFFSVRAPNVTCEAAGRSNRCNVSMVGKWLTSADRFHGYNPNGSECNSMPHCIPMGLGSELNILSTHFVLTPVEIPFSDSYALVLFIEFIRDMHNLDPYTVVVEASKRKRSVSFHHSIGDTHREIQRKNIQKTYSKLCINPGKCDCPHCNCYQNMWCSAGTCQHPERHHGPLCADGLDDVGTLKTWAEDAINSLRDAVAALTAQVNVNTAAINALTSSLTSKLAEVWDTFRIIQRFDSTLFSRLKVDESKMNQLEGIVVENRQHIINITIYVNELIQYTHVYRPLFDAAEAIFDQLLVVERELAWTISQVDGSWGALSDLPLTILPHIEVYQKSLCGGSVSALTGMYTVTDSILYIYTFVEYQVDVQCVGLFEVETTVKDTYVQYSVQISTHKINFLVELDGNRDVCGFMQLDSTNCNSADDVSDPWAYYVNSTCLLAGDQPVQPVGRGTLLTPFRCPQDTIYVRQGSVRTYPTPHLLQVNYVNTSIVQGDSIWVGDRLLTIPVNESAIVFGDDDNGTLDMLLAELTDRISQYFAQAQYEENSTAIPTIDISGFLNIPSAPDVHSTRDDTSWKKHLGILYGLLVTAVVLGVLVLLYLGYRVYKKGTTHKYTITPRSQAMKLIPTSQSPPPTP